VRLQSYIMTLLEAIGALFGLLAVWFLVKENILTWPAGIVYCLISFVVFWQVKLYQDFLLTGFFLAMNIYGWYAWRHPRKIKKTSGELPITTSRWQLLMVLGFISIVLIFISGYLFQRYTDASLPYGDATTTILSLSAMWMTARKKIENWVIWFAVDVLATIIYFYKGIYFYSALYLLYLGLAVAGYISWKKLMVAQQLKTI